MSRTVSVQATEPLLRAGAVDLLRGAAGIRLTGDRPHTILYVTAECRQPDLTQLATDNWSTGQSGGVVLVTDHLAAVDVPLARRCGVRAILGRGCATRQRLVDAVLADRRPDLPELQAQAQALRAVPSSELTAVEHQLLTLIADGWSVPEIARLTRRSTGTVRRIQSRIYRRFGSRTGSRCVAVAIRQGVI